MKHLARAAALAVAGLAFSAGSGQAVVLDGVIVCTPSKLFQCVADGGCEATDKTPDLGLLPKLTVDFRSQVIMSPSEQNAVEASKMQTIVRQQGNVIIQGFEEGYGWTMSIDEESGKMAISISEEGTGVIAFGSCESL